MADLATVLVVGLSLTVASGYTVALLSVIYDRDPRRWIAIRVIRLFVRLRLVKRRD